MGIDVQSGWPNEVVLMRHARGELQVAGAASRDGDDSWQHRPGIQERHESLARLTDSGISQAHAAGRWIRTYGRFDFYRTSPVPRAAETAGHLRLGREVRWQQDPGLGEQDYGTEALTTAVDRGCPALVQAAQWHDSSPFFAGPVGGETIAQVYQRACAVRDQYRREADGQRVLLVSHSEFMGAFHLAVTGVPPLRYAEWLRTHHIRNCELYAYSWRANPDDRDSDRLEPGQTWWRSICTASPPRELPPWTLLKWPTFSSDELLMLVNETTPPRIING